MHGDETKGVYTNAPMPVLPFGHGFIMTVDREAPGNDNRSAG